MLIFTTFPLIKFCVFLRNPLPTVYFRVFSTFRRRKSVVLSGAHLLINDYKCNSLHEFSVQCVSRNQHGFFSHFVYFKNCTRNKGEHPKIKFYGSSRHQALTSKPLKMVPNGANSSKIDQIKFSTSNRAVSDQNRTVFVHR